VIACGMLAVPEPNVLRGSVSSLIPQALNLSPFRDASERAGALFETLRLS